jgi:hypothetical protein
MITLTALSSRILQALQDPAGKRYDEPTLAEAARQALDLINPRLPNIITCDFTVTTTGRSQVLTGLENCLYLVSLCVNPGEGSSELEPENGFSYRFQNGVPTLYFPGIAYPQVGDVLRVTCALPHTLSGLDDETETTLPPACVNALVDGAAGQACLMRATALTEAYGARTVEVTRLLDLSRTLMVRFDQSLSQFKTLQTFGFPPGFGLDADDSQTGRH